MLIGVLLVVLGIAGLVVQNVQFTDTKKVLDLGPLQVRSEERHNVPIPTIAGVVAVLAGLLPIGLVGELVSIGTLFAFAVVSIGTLALRIIEPELPRPFRAPAIWVIAPAGAATSIFLMLGLPGDTWIRLAVWLLVGFAIYFVYGAKHSRLRGGEKRGES